LAVPLLQPLCYAQAVYKWTDANGKVHYGDARQAPNNSKKIAEKDVVAEASSASSIMNSKDSKKSVPESADGKAEFQAFQGISAERIQKCSRIAKEVLLMQFDTSNMAKDSIRHRTLLDQIRATCTGTGFECTLSRINPKKDRCEPFAWKGMGEMLRADIDDTKVKAGPGKF
jgi:hypothetical protein